MFLVIHEIGPNRSASYPVLHASLWGPRDTTHDHSRRHVTPAHLWTSLCLPSLCAPQHFIHSSKVQEAGTLSIAVRLTIPARSRPPDSPPTWQTESVNVGRSVNTTIKRAETSSRWTKAKGTSLNSERVLIFRGMATQGNSNRGCDGGGRRETEIEVAQPPPPPPPPRGQLLLGRYEVGRLLGHGTFAKVYHARSTGTGESVAIKVLDKEKILKGGLIGHIKREIAILRRVRHPNIVQLFEVMATKAKIYFVMEYVRGGELFGRVAKGRLREETARKYFQQLVSAVTFCHARGVYHRDLKPENLLLDENGDLKVTDFGLSAISEQTRQDGLFHTFCGTPAYVAPEVLARKGYDAAKVDIWSCGIILFVLMAGYLPFHDQNVMAMYRKIYKGEFRCPRWFSPELIRLLTRVLDTNPETRFTIPEIMENRWFKKGFRHIRFYVENDRVYNVDDIDAVEEDDSAAPSEKSESEAESDADSDCSTSSLPDSFRPRRVGLRRAGLGLPRPASLNAFDIISFSRGFDLSGLFEERGEESRFISGEPVSKIISKLEEIAKVVSFSVRKKDCQVSLEGTREGVKGPLTIAAEIFELTSSLVVVEVRMKAGDREEYEEFCNKELKPGLRNLVYDQSVTAANIASDTE